MIRKRDVKPSISLDQVKAEVRRLDPTLQVDSNEFRAAVILLSFLIVGPIAFHISCFTKYPYQQVMRLVRNIKNAGIWKRGQLHVDWFDEETGGISFWCDVCVALGLMQRVRTKATPATCRARIE